MSSLNSEISIRMFEPTPRRQCFDESQSSPSRRTQDKFGWGGGEEVKVTPDRSDYYIDRRLDALISTILPVLASNQSWEIRELLKRLSGACPQRDRKSEWKLRQ